MRQFCLLLTIAFFSCGPNNQSQSSEVEEEVNTGVNFIPLDTANLMIGSYLESVGHEFNPDTLLSWSVDAASLRAYLKHNPTIQGIKFMLAHKQSYIADNYGKPAGFSPSALTMVIAGYDSEGNYKFYGTNLVLNRLAPCPPSCPHGSAADPLFTIPE